MRLQFMRRVDKIAGALIIPPLYFWTVVKKALSPKKLQANIQNSRSILIQKYFGMGSIINSIPLLHSLRDANPNAKLIFVTLEGNRELFELLGIVDELITIRLTNFFVFLIDVFRALFKLRGKGIDICIDLEFYSSFSKIFSFFTKSPVLVGFSPAFSYKCLLVTHPVSYNHYRHISRIFLAFGEAVGVKIDESNDFSGKLFFPSLQQRFGAAIDQIIGADGAPIITVNVVSSQLIPLRKWKKEKYIDLIAYITEDYPQYKVVLTGLPEDVGYVADVVAAQKNKRMIVNAAGKTSIGQLFALIERTCLLISNDSGPAHIAAGYNTNSIILFGPETPVLYQPINKNLEIIYKGLYCSPCIYVIDNKSYESCKLVECMELITPEEVRKIIKNRFLG